MAKGNGTDQCRQPMNMFVDDTQDFLISDSPKILTSNEDIKEVFSKTIIQLVEYFNHRLNYEVEDDETEGAIYSNFKEICYEYHKFIDNKDRYNLEELLKNIKYTHPEFSGAYNKQLLDHLESINKNKLSDLSEAFENVTYVSSSSMDISIDELQDTLENTKL